MSGKDFVHLLFLSANTGGRFCPKDYVRMNYVCGNFVRLPIGKGKVKKNPKLIHFILQTLLGFPFSWCCQHFCKLGA